MVFDFRGKWVELAFFILIILGFIFSILTRNLVLSYSLIFVAGMGSGRLLFERKNKLQLPYYLMIIGFLIGYILGAFYGNRNVMIILFILGSFISYYLHDKGYIQDISI